ncbi:hypothetical protein GDO78_005033 [Eleutherodactylus coqui]|uniref:Uncharacterized protein n=1 Tax=Eleutherodactylus coqui TaxID=57060 RepID=A0A8J6KCE8_ELECQ|nr:hypothetical protein GDO78_005033 [Eleutherodactylus coqui]
MLVYSTRCLPLQLGFPSTQLPSAVWYERCKHVCVFIYWCLIVHRTLNGHFFFSFKCTHYINHITEGGMFPLSAIH